MIVTDAVLAALLAAVPSYAAPWRERRADLAPERVSLEFRVGLAAHLVERAAAGEISELGPFFDAVDGLYKAGDPDVDDWLTVGLLEDLINLADSHGGDVPARLAAHVRGTEARRGWDAAFAYTHPTRTRR